MTDQKGNIFSSVTNYFLPKISNKNTPQTIDHSQKKQTNIFISKQINIDNKDPLIDQALEIVTQFGKASASLLQRRLSIGYARATKILDDLEILGFLGPAIGTKPRDVARTQEQFDNFKLNYKYYYEKNQKEKEEKNIKDELEYKQFTQKYQKYIDKFCEFAEQKVSILDKQGNEKWEILNKLKKECIINIAKNIFKKVYLQDKIATVKFFGYWFEADYRDLDKSNKINYSAPYWVKKLYNQDLYIAFQQYLTSGNRKIDTNKI